MVSSYGRDQLTRSPDPLSYFGVEFAVALIIGSVSLFAYSVRNRRKRDCGEPDPIEAVAFAAGGNPEEYRKRDRGQDVRWF
jgi:hypothetical protein